MALDTLLINELTNINGYLASGIMDYTGELLASHSVSSKVDLTVIAASFNDSFRANHEVATKVGFGTLEEQVLVTPNGLIVMACSGLSAPIHLHVIALLKRDGNQALAKIALDKIKHRAVEELSK
jgi:predicted regulator of Ras-like GTPase activity (Roadblock/LC7/MglB family)